MRRWFDVIPSPLRAPEDEGGGGGSDTVRVADPGAEHPLDDDTPAPATPRKTAAEQRAEELEADNKRLKAVADENARDARYWADRARNAAAAPARRAADDEEPAPRRREPAAAPIEKPEELIDDLNKRGLAALSDRGFISKDELAQALEDVRESNQADITEARNEAVFTGRLEAEFPEMMEDSNRVAKGLAPKSELFAKAGEIYRELVDLDPSLKNSRGLLLIAARQAKAALKGGKGASDEPAPRRGAAADDDDQARRRQRIARQNPDRGREDEDTDAGGGHSADSLEVMKRLKVKPEEYDRHKDAKGGRRNGRN
jgi:hypothetical protein